MIQFVLIIKTIWFKKNNIGQIRSSFFVKIYDEHQQMLQCVFFGWTNEIFPLYNGDLLFWVLFCFAFLPDKRLFIFPGSKIQGVLWTRVFYDNCFFAHFQSVNLCKANWSATNKKIFWHFLQFNWIYRVFPWIGDTKIITRSEMNYGYLNISTTK